MKPLYALVAETCKHRDVLEQLLAGSSELSASGIDPHLSKILITELIWGRGYLKPENARAIHTILGIESQLRSSLKGLQSSHPEQPLEFQGMILDLFIICLSLSLQRNGSEQGCH